MRGVITAPKGIITGAFNLLFSFPMDVDFTANDFRVETLSGDALGDPRDCLIKGGGNHYMFQCYVPVSCYGRSRVSLDFEVDGTPVDAKPVILEYDTVKEVMGSFGEPVRRGNEITVPFSLKRSVVGLTKQHFELIQVSGMSLSGIQFYLYGSEKTYELVFRGQNINNGEFSIAVGPKKIQKSNELQATIYAESISI